MNYIEVYRNVYIILELYRIMGREIREFCKSCEHRTDDCFIGDDD